LKASVISRLQYHQGANDLADHRARLRAHSPAPRNCCKIRARSKAAGVAPGTTRSARLPPGMPQVAQLGRPPGPVTRACLFCAFIVGAEWRSCRRNPEKGHGRNSRMVRGRDAQRQGAVTGLRIRCARGLRPSAVARDPQTRPPAQGSARRRPPTSPREADHSTDDRFGNRNPALTWRSLGLASRTPRG
jgi:hypothetical protein